MSPGSFAFVWLIPARSAGGLVYSCSFGLLWFKRERPCSCRVYSASFGSFRRATAVIGFIRVRSAHSGAPRGTFSSFGRAPCVGMFIRAHPVLHSFLFGSFPFDWFIRARPGSLRVHSCSFQFVWMIRARVSLVHSGAPQWSSGSSGFVWLIRARLGVCRVDSGSFGSFGRASRVIRVRHRATGFVRVHLVHSGSPLRSSGSFVFVWFIRASPGGRSVYSGSFGRAPGVVGFIWAHPGGSRVDCFFD